MRIEFEADITPIRQQRPRPTQPPPSAADQIGRVVRYLVLAWQIEQAVAEGRAHDFSDAASQLGLSRARISQVMGLRFLSPRIQEILLTEPHRAVRISERQLRPIIEVLDWNRQWKMFRPMLTASGRPSHHDHHDRACSATSTPATSSDNPNRTA